MFLYLISKKFNCFFPSPINVVFVTTTKCNSKCRTCFIWKSPEAEKGELSVEEYKKLLRSMDKVYWVTIGGGEPFLREDFFEIATNICNYLRPKVLNIPTNGSKPNRIWYVMNGLIKRYPGVQFTLNVSVDHIGEQHDWIRGLPGNFSLIFQTVERLKRIKNTNFILGIHTVISKFNFKDFQYVYHWIVENFQPDFYIIENAQLREELRNQRISLLNEPDDYIKVINFFLDKMRREKYSGFLNLKKAFRITYYKSVKNFLILNQRPYSCYAGYASCQIAPNGEVWACATRGYVMGDLKKYNYNFAQLWTSLQANSIREKIKNEQCFCSLSNTSYTNILLNPKRLFQVLWYLIR